MRQYVSQRLEDSIALMLGHTLAYFLSSAVIVLSLGLIVLCTLVFARDVIPVVCVPGSIYFHILRVLLSGVSFHILFHYVCATAVSSRLGSAPASKRHSDAVQTWAMSHDSLYRPRDATSTTIHPNAKITSPASATATGTDISSKASYSHCSLVSLPTANPTSSAKTRTRWRSWWRVFHILTRSIHTPRAATTRTASPATLHELHRLAVAAEQDCAHGKSYRVLDRPTRYCHTCQRLKAPREHHCSICNTCVPKMDHHCPWINNCVDVENERSFVLLIAWLWCGTVLATGILGRALAMQLRYEQRVREYALHATRVFDISVDKGTQLGTLYSTLVDEWAVVRQSAPLGIHGNRIHSFAVTLLLICVVCIGVCMSYFLYSSAVHVRYNVTPVEEMMLSRRARAAETPMHGRRTEQPSQWRSAPALDRSCDDVEAVHSRCRCCRLLVQCYRTLWYCTARCLRCVAYWMDSSMAGHAYTANPYNLGVWANILSIVGLPNDPVVRLAWRRMLPTMSKSSSNFNNICMNDAIKVHRVSATSSSSSSVAAADAATRATTISSSALTRALSTSSTALRTLVSGAEVSHACSPQRRHSRSVRLCSSIFASVGRVVWHVTHRCVTRGCADACTQAPARAARRLRMVSWKDGLTVAWLLLVPSLQPRDSDGMHYPVWDDFAHAYIRTLTADTNTLE